MGSEALHNDIVDVLYENPYKHLGFDEDTLISKVTEFEMYKDGKLYVKPDLYIQSTEGHYFFEVKSANNPRRIAKAEKQADRVDEWLELYMPQIYNDSKIALVLPKVKQKKLRRIMNNLEVLWYTKDS